MENGWTVVIALIAFIAGGIFTGDTLASRNREAAKTGIMVVDGEAYVLVPAKKGF